MVSTMKKYFLFAVLAALVPNLCFGVSARYTQLVREKQRKMEELEKCMGAQKGLKIAGVSTLGLTAVGVAGNIYEASAIKKYDSEIESADKAIAKTQKDIDKKTKELATKGTQLTQQEQKCKDEVLSLIDKNDNAYKQAINDYIEKFNENETEDENEIIIFEGTKKVCKPGDKFKDCLGEDFMQSMGDAYAKSELIKEKCGIDEPVDIVIKKNTEKTIDKTNSKGLSIKEIIEQDIASFKTNKIELGDKFITHGYYIEQLSGDLEQYKNSLRDYYVKFMTECNELKYDNIITQVSVTPTTSDITDGNILERLPKIDDPDKVLDNIEEHVILHCRASKCNQNTHKLVDDKCVPKDTVVENVSSDEGQTCISLQNAQSLGYWAKLTPSYCTSSEDTQCNRSFSDLAPGEWKVLFDQGTIKGSAICSTTKGSVVGESGNPDNQKGAFCWCKIKQHKDNHSKNCDIESYPTVFSVETQSAAVCENRCATDCAKSVYNNASFRRAFF